MSLILGTMHILVIRSKNYPITDETLEVSHVREVVAGIPFEEAFSLCLSYLKESSGYRAISEDRGTGRINARATLSLWSWGEKISFEVRKREGGGSLIRVSSKPEVPTTIVDYGRNLANVERAAAYIKNRAT